MIITRLHNHLGPYGHIFAVQVQCVGLYALPLTPCQEVEEAGSHHLVEEEGSQVHKRMSLYSSQELQSCILLQNQYCH